MEEQLDRFYLRDPEAGGYGIYGVFWFGADNRGATLPAHPGSLAAPASPSELQQMLIDLLPEAKRSRIAVVVIDVSGPPA